jgi:excisionase family DNA binding protein
MEKLLTVREAAQELRMAELWVRKKIHEGRIKHIKMGGRYFISQEEITRCKKDGIE